MAGSTVHLPEGFLAVNDVLEKNHVIGKYVLNRIIMIIIIIIITIIVIIIIIITIIFNNNNSIV